MNDRPSRLAIATAALLAAAAVALTLGPFALDAPGYDWVEHTTSEAAAQGVGGAWLTRAGFVAFGCAAMLHAARCLGQRGPAVAVGLAVFGAGLLVAAARSTRPWWPDPVYDAGEDAWHSVAATTVGIAFTYTMVTMAVVDPQRRWWHVTAGLVAVVIPLAMLWWPDGSGLLQRAMFAVAIGWFALDIDAADQPTARR